MIPRRPDSARPSWLNRLHIRAKARPLAWLDLHFATMAAAMLGLGLLLWLLSPILAPFLAAAILAYIFDPAVSKMEARGVPRALGTVLALLLLIVAGDLPLVLIPSPVLQ